MIERVGGLGPGFEGGRDYDLLLRISELTDRFVHLPKVLYHRRTVAGSATARIGAKPNAFQSSKKALREAMARRGLSASVIDGPTPGRSPSLQRVRRNPP